MRRLLGADSLRSDNRYSLDPPPHCGATDALMRRLLGADSLRSDNRYPLDPPHCGGSGPIGPRLMSRCLEPGSDSLCSLLDVRELI